jgi:tRNA-Thr(GGU) m(6)t(6)A37 methyltransferase TsaA
MQPPSPPIVLEPIAYVRGGRTAARDDGWDAEIATIELADPFGPEALVGLETFSHVEVLFLFHLVNPNAVERGARHPRGNTDWPRVGIFAQRGKDRPNRIGVTVAKILSCHDRTLTLQGLDAIDGTPILDLKPVMAEFLPRGQIRQPKWSQELMQNYW